jgi:hypothetical protein
MTPAKRGSATPASQGPARTAPDVPIAANGPAPAGKTKDDSQLLGPEGEPIAQEARTRDAGGGSARSTETGKPSSDDGAATQARRRPGGLYPLPVWPD